MRLFALLFASLCFICAPVQAAKTATQWPAYPAELPQFDYSGAALQNAWPTLSLGNQQPFPDAQFLQQVFSQYPKAHSLLLAQASDAEAHPALQALATSDLQPLADALQQVWRLHYQGQFQEAYELGMQLGIVGAVPAIYSQLMHTTFLVKEPEQKLQTFQQTLELAERYLAYTPDYEFAEFGILYAQGRILEQMNSTEALATGYLSQTQKRLKHFFEQDPNHSIYPTTLGGFQAGIVERVGSAVGRVTYGATAGSSIKYFEQALALEPRLPVIYHEYIVALKRLNPKKYQQRIQELAQKCQKLTVYSAEEALNQQQCTP